MKYIILAWSLVILILAVCLIRSAATTITKHNQSVHAKLADH